MSRGRVARIAGGLVAAVAALSLGVSAEAQEKKLKIGVVYDLTGPLAGGGSELQYIGAKIVLDQFAKTGVEGYKIEAIYADAQSKPDVAINEAVRLVERKRSTCCSASIRRRSACRSPARVEQLKKFLWITTCISSAVLEDRNLKYVFRAQPSGAQFGTMTVEFIDAERQGEARQGAQGPARRHRPRGRRLRRRRLQGQRGRGQEGRLQHRAQGGLLGDRPRPLVAGDQAQRARPDVLFHTGYNPDITLLPAPGAGAGPASSRPWSVTARATASYDKLKESVGRRTSTISSTPTRSRSGSATRRRSSRAGRRRSRRRR